MESFISRQELSKLQSRSRFSTRVFRAAAAGTLILFVVLCLIIRTANARTVTWAMFISMTVRVQRPGRPAGAGESAASGNATVRKTGGI